jgi:hypothetical protein
MKRGALSQAAATARAAGIAVTRADRVVGRPRCALSLDAIADWPRWPAFAAAERERVWRLAALIAARDAVAEVIDGATLRAFAGAVGEPALDAILSLPGGGEAPLPPATLLGESGRRLAEAGLPPPLAAAMGMPGGDPTAATTIATAEAIAA